MLKSINLSVLFLILLAANASRANVVTNIEYGLAGGQSLRLDVSTPDGKGPFPVALIVHGGGWGTGDKADGFCKLLNPLLSSNFTWISINYRLAPSNHWPACFEDVQSAIRWVKAHAAEYKGDPQRLALFGYSAGGHLACLAAVLARDDTRVQAVVGFAPPTDLVADCERRGGVSLSLQNLLARPQALDAEARNVLREMSPLNYLKPGLPPFLLLHGTEDKSVPYNQSLNFQAKLCEFKVPCELVTIPGAPHDIQKWQKLEPQYPQKLLTWLAQVFPAKEPLPK